ncbi:prostaglandin reductase 1 isoform X3 [Hydra vulgaris]|uniref:Prostaglandin reductase 1 n=1 Tax=Hydra vulgaris TaxID=6087 RepID=A0ABM4D6C8_HYDVU
MTGKIIAKSFLLKNHFDGLPKEEDFELVEEVLPTLADGEFLCENLYLSVDPYMRPYSTQIKAGSLMIGGGVARVIESKNSTYPVGTIVVSGQCGWTTHFIPIKSVHDSKMFHIVPPFLKDVSHAIGVLGLTGLTAYFGFLDICQPKFGETVFVNTAAGAVGSIVGQIAKIKGCHVVGCTSSDEKIEYLKEIGFDGAFNYKTANIEEKLKEFCPKGIDCFFDNVGGPMFDTVLSLMNRYGRVSVCGSISTYNEKESSKVKGPYVHNYIIHKELKIQGFMAPSYYDRYEEGVQNLHSWMQQMSQNSKLTKTWYYKSAFDGLPKEDDFEMKVSDLPTIADEEFLCENLYLSVDPYMRYFASHMTPGQIMIGAGVSRVIESKNEKYPVGTLLTAACGWTTHFVPKEIDMQHPVFKVIPIDLEEPSLALGVLGSTGLTAYHGLLDICAPKSGETVFVNTAAGAVGSIVGQLAKLKGCHVVGCTSSDDKVAYLKEIGFDGAFNYKTENMKEKLKELCPKGIDCFFDNVGGSQFDIALSEMNRHGRVALCGSISLYNEKEMFQVKGPYVHLFAIHNELKIQGFMVLTLYKDRFVEAFKEMHGYLTEGKISARDHVVKGFESMPKALIGLFHSVNIGKVVVKC